MKKKKILIILSAILLFVFSFYIYCYFENRIIDVEEITVTDEDLPNGFNGYRIVHISDFHNTEFKDGNADLIEIITENAPDIIVVTGDLISCYDVNVDKAMLLIDEIVKIAPVYYVNGNHEPRTDEYPLLVERLTLSGVKILNDEVITLERGGEKINLIGLEDPFFSDTTGKYNEEILDEKLNNLSLDESVYSILLTHRPEHIELYAQYNINLAFAGHAHGGQIRFPFLNGIIAPNQGFFPKYTSGLYTEGNTNLIVSRGLGNSSIPIRINNNPHLIIAILQNGK